VDKIGRTVTSQAVAWDLEANVQEAVEYTNRITIGGDDGVKTAALAAISLAKRNAKFALIPRVVWWPVFQKCMDVAVGSAVPIGAQIIEMQKAFSRYGIVLEQIMEKLGRTHPGDITEEDILKLRGFYVAIKENEAQAQDIFPPVASRAKPEADGTPESTSLDAPRRRGRPPKQPAATTQASEPQKQETAQAFPTGPTPAEPEAQEEAKNVSQFPSGPAQPEPQEEPETDSKLNTINKLKALLERDGKSEAGLLAKMREWSIDKDLTSQPINLEDYRENSLVQIVERWDHLSTHFK
jgi:hypothetical protein